jgi:hypothetical protein
MSKITIITDPNYITCSECGGTGTIQGIDPSYTNDSTAVPYCNFTWPNCKGRGMVPLNKEINS